MLLPNCLARCFLVSATTMLIARLSALNAADDSNRIELGPPETVLADKALGLRYFPDGGMAVVQTQPVCRVLVAAGVSSYLLEGIEIGHFTKATKVLDQGRAGDFDDGYAGINAVVRAKMGELLAFYHAEDQEGMKTVGNGIPGFYCRVALAVSRDDGATFEKRGPILSGQSPKDPNRGADQGVGEPCVVAEASGEFLYAYYTSHERIDGRGVDICLARCRATDAAKSGAWKKWHAGEFTEPGLGGKDTPLVTGEQPDADALFPHVVFLPARRQFAMIFCLNAWHEKGKPERSGIYAAFSDDGIHWPRERMQQIWKVPVTAALGREVAWHPTFITNGDGGARGWLYYGYSEDWGHQPPHTPHYLMRRSMAVGGIDH